MSHYQPIHPPGISCDEFEAAVSDLLQMQLLRQGQPSDDIAWLAGLHGEDGGLVQEEVQDSLLDRGDVVLVGKQEHRLGSILQCGYKASQSSEMMPAMLEQD